MKAASKAVYLCFVMAGHQSTAAYGYQGRPGFCRELEAGED